MRNTYMYIYKPRNKDADEHCIRKKIREILWDKRIGKNAEQISSNFNVRKFSSCFCLAEMLESGLFATSHLVIISLRCSSSLYVCVWVHKSPVHKPTSFVEQQSYHEHDNGMVMTTTIRMIVKTLHLQIFKL